MSPTDRDSPAPVIRPTEFAVDPVPSGADAGGPAAHRDPRRLPRVLTAVLLVVGLVGVFVWLPERVADNGAAEMSEADRSAPPPAAAQTPATERPSPPVDVDDPKVRAARREAQERQRAAEQGLAELVARGVERWAPAETARVREALTMGEAAYRELAYADAREAFGEAAARVDALASEAGAAFERALTAGLQALAAGDAAAASAAFEMALMIRPDAEEARRGLERSQRLPEVMAAMAEGAEYEAQGALDEALAAYQRAAAIDPDFARATDRVAALKARITERDFKRAMARGYEAFNRGALGTARAQFEAARRLSPKAPEVAEALADVAGEARARKVTSLRRDAERAAAAGEWQRAVAAYEDLMALDLADPSLERSLETARRQAELDAALAEMAADPGQLATEAGRNRLASLAVAADELGPSSPDRAATLARLERIERIMTTPVPVTLVSDGQTRVTVYRHGRLGTFERTEVDLTPGRYVAVGVREGYRDVRVEFVVEPDDPDRRVVVRCVDPIVASR